MNYHLWHLAFMSDTKCSNNQKIMYKKIWYEYIWVANHVQRKRPNIRSFNNKSFDFTAVTTMLWKILQLICAIAMFQLALFLFFFQHSLPVECLPSLSSIYLMCRLGKLPKLVDVELVVGRLFRSPWKFHPQTWNQENTKITRGWLLNHNKRDVHPP